MLAWLKRLLSPPAAVSATPSEHPRDIAALGGDLLRVAQSLGALAAQVGNRASEFPDPAAAAHAALKMSEGCSRVAAGVRDLVRTLLPQHGEAAPPIARSPGGHLLH
jgi:hypothetical protein